jgi:signal transduction histidine kinase
MALSTLNILIADDDVGDRTQIRRCLERAGIACECTEVVSIEHAVVEACRHADFDCAILDYRMPGSDGLQGISALHERFPYMPIIMLTGQGDEIVATEAMKRGAYDYIPKARVDAQSIKYIIEGAVTNSALRRKVVQQRKELEDFAAGIVHDLKAPIAAVQTFASFIEDEVRAQIVDQDKIVAHCQSAVSAGRRLGALIDALYAYTKVDAEATFEPVEMGKVMDDALSALQYLIGERHLQLTCSELPVVIGNAPQLVQLLEGLLDNAIKYSEVGTPTVHVAAAPDHDSAWLFSVKDNGIGIPEKFLQHVFEPFRRLPHAGKYDGTGLGLATCKRIVERHRGTIWCESKPGKGTTVFFVLPSCIKAAVSR